MTEAIAPDNAPHETTLERYVRFWNADGSHSHHHLASETFTDDVTYHAPIGVLTGPQALIDFRDQFTRHVGAVVFRRREEPQIHHDRARLMWEIEARGESFAAGTDVLVFDPDGRVSSVSAFLDRAPVGFDPHAHD